VLYISLLRAALPLFALIIGSYTDIKERIIPNYITYGLFIAGIAISIVESGIYSSLQPIIQSIQGIVVAAIFGGILYKLGVWAGGDFKLLLGIGAINPVLPRTPLLLYATPLDSWPFFPITFVVYSLLAIFPYILLLSVWQTIKRPDIRKIPLIQLYNNKTNLLVTAAVITATVSILNWLQQSLLWVIPIVLLAEKIVYSRSSSTKYWLSVILLAFSVIMSYGALLQFIYTLCWLALIPILWGYVKIIRTYILREEVSVQDLQEGMIPAEYIIVNEDRVTMQEARIIPSIEDIRNGRINKQMQGRKIGDPHCADGFSEEDIQTLRKLARSGKMPSTIIVKKTIAFIPTLTLGYGLALIFGNIIWTVV